jgi:3-hydroxybutyrate dehydrogenase
MFDVNGHVAVVTGAATGIGKAIAQRLVKAGAIVAVADLNACGAREVAAVLGGSSFAVQKL